MIKKKILFWVVAFDKGGLEKVTLDIVNNLDPDKYDITVMQMYNGGYCQSLLKSHINQTYFFEKFIRGIAKLIEYLPNQTIYNHFIKEKYDVEIAVGDGLPCRVIGGSNNQNSKKIAWIHMDVLKRGASHYEFATEKGRKKFYEPFNIIACVSEDCRRSFVGKFGFEERTVVKYNPVPVNQILSKANEPLDAEFSKEELNLITVGRLVRQKGFDRLLEVHKKLKDDGFKYKLFIVGEGIERHSLENYIREEGLSDSVILLGFNSNPYKYIKNADLYICSSRDEASSIVIAESLILGVPVISTRCAGQNELLKNGECGLLVDNTTEALYYGLKALLSEDSKLKYYKQKGIERGKDFNFQKALKKFEKLL